MATRLKVLVCAYACNPLRGSEPGVGWHWVKGLAEHCDLDVITADSRGSRAAVEAALAQEPQLAGRVAFHFLPDFHPVTSKVDAFLLKYYQPLYYRYYNRWMRAAVVRARDLVKEKRFDLAHQLTMIGYREPGYFWTLGLPFVWGPVGGTQDVPWRFLPSLGAVEGLRHACRNTLNAGQFRFHSRFRRALKSSVLLIATATDISEAIRRRYGKESIVVPASFAVPQGELATVREWEAGEPLRLVFSGLHLSRKGLPFLLRALARLGEAVDWRLDVLGAGVMTEKWKAEALGLGRGERIQWRGQLPREAALRHMSDAHLFVFPSLQEGSPAVVAEAMALGLPIVTMGHHGMLDYVDETSGWLIPVETPASAISFIETVLRDIVRNPGLIRARSAGALRRSVEFGPDAQARRVVEAYHRVLGGEPQ